MSIGITIGCDHADVAGTCPARTPPAPTVDAARGLARTQRWHLGGRAGDRCPSHHPARLIAVLALDPDDDLDPSTLHLPGAHPS